jgi:hypothetical protein
VNITRIILTEELKDKINKRLPSGMTLNGIDKVNSCWYEVDYTWDGVNTRVKIDMIGRMLSIRVADGEWLAAVVEAETNVRFESIKIKDICYLFVGYVGYLADTNKIDKKGEIYRIHTEIHVGNEVNFRELVDHFWDKVVVYTYPQAPDRFCVEMIARFVDGQNMRYYYRSTEDEIILEHPVLSIKFASTAFKSRNTTKILRLLKATRAAITASENPPRRETVEEET